VFGTYVFTVHVILKVFGTNVPNNKTLEGQSLAWSVTEYDHW
jgi:hypothetical protein